MVCGNKSRGAVLIEFAFVLPLFLLLTVGIIELSNAFITLNNLNKSVRDGISYMSRHAINATNNGVANPLDTTSVNNTKSYIAANFNATRVGQGALLPVNDIDVEPEGTNHIKISATYNYNLILGSLLGNIINIMFPGSGFGTEIPLTTSAVYRVI